MARRSRAAVVRLAEAAQSPPSPTPVAPRLPAQPPTPVPARYRVDWASLLKRVWG